MAFGATPSHTFTDDGVYSGQLTATDPTGLSNIEAFSVTVGNQDPIANAGPGHHGRLGPAGRASVAPPPTRAPATSPRSSTAGTSATARRRPIPSGSGGSGVFHAYATPGDYVATLTVTDKDGGSDTDTRTVHVTKRDTTAAYTGPTSADVRHARPP